MARLLKQSKEGMGARKKRRQKDKDSRKKGLQKDRAMEEDKDSRRKGKAIVTEDNAGGRGAHRRDINALEDS